MDTLQTAYLQRARSAIDFAIGEQGDTSASRAKAFIGIAQEMLIAKGLQEARPRLERHSNPLVTKAAANITLDAEWIGANIAELAQAYLAEIAPGSLLDAIARHARAMPKDRRILMASGFTADIVNEGAPAVVKHLDLHTAQGDDVKKAAAIIVLSQELARLAGDAGQALFANELGNAINRGTNAAVRNELIDTSAINVASTTDPVADLRTALLAAPASTGYVVSAAPGVAAALALSPENKGGMGIRGGTMVQGIDVVAVEGETYMTIIPAGGIAMTDYGLELRSSGEASVDMRDTPSSPATLTSLFQTNSVGIIAVRGFEFFRRDHAVIVG